MTGDRVMRGDELQRGVPCRHACRCDSLRDDPSSMSDATREPVQTIGEGKE